MEQSSRRRRADFALTKARALASLQGGDYQAAVARRLRISRFTLNRWARQWEASGVLRAATYSAAKFYDPPQRIAPTKSASGKVRIAPINDGVVGSQRPPRVGATSIPRSNIRRGVYVGTHYWQYSAKVREPGRDIGDLLPGSYALRGVTVRWGELESEGARIRVERHAPTNPARGYGSIVLRFSLWALPGEMPTALSRRARRLAARVYGAWRDRGLRTGPYRETSKPHREIAADPVAERIGKERTVRVEDRNGHGWIDRSHGGDLEFDSDESAAAYIQLNSNVDHLIDRLPKTEAKLDALVRLIDALVGVRSRQRPPQQRTLEPSGVDVGRP